MDNTEKLIRAWLKCKGYEIESISCMPKACECAAGTGRGCHKCDGTGIATTEIDYKVTKKQESPFPWMKTNDPAWSAIVGYLLGHKEDIEIGINDFGDLKPVLEFFSRNCKELTSEDIIQTFGESIL